MRFGNSYLKAIALSAITSVIYAQNNIQTYNGTILQLLNDTSISPSTKLAQYLFNSSDYQPIIDILSNTTHNVTFFLPSDQVYYEATGETPPTRSNSSTTAAAAPTAASSSQSNSRAASSSATSSSAGGIGGFFSSIIGGQSSQTAAQTTSQQATGTGASPPSQTSINLPPFTTGQQNAWSNPLVDIGRASNKAAGWEAVTTDATLANKFSYMDIIYYHLVNGTVDLTNNNSTLILNSMLTNQSVVKTGSSAPLVAQQNNTNWTVGSGLGDGAQINRTFQTTNGIVHVINKILIPPVNASDTLPQVSDISYFTWLLNQTNVTLDYGSNFTVFVPSNDAMKNVSVVQLNNETLYNLIEAHIVPGIYYTTNATNSTQVQSSEGTNITLRESSNNVTVNNFNITKPNILLSNGVLHVIDGVLNYTVVQSGGSNNGGGNSNGSGNNDNNGNNGNGNNGNDGNGDNQPTSPGGQTASQTSDSGPFPAPTNSGATVNIRSAYSIMFCLLGFILYLTF